MKDRLIFKTAKLKNGIRIFTKPMDVPFAYAWIYVPVGHIHNTGSVLPGTAHLLEHIACGRSRLYPKLDQFQKMIELAGGSFDASTCSLYTVYNISIRSDMFNRAFRGLMSHVFDPLIKAEDISHEVGVILSESKRNNKWYPGDDELGHHLMMKWRNTRVFNNRQRTGNRSDLKKMSVAKLTQLHKAYFDPRAYVVVGGSFDKKVVFKELNKLKTKRHNLPTKLEQISWVNRGYHEKKFDTISRYLYYMGGIMTESNVMTNFAISFIGELLTNSTHGVLMEWLRNELGWCYDMNFNMECDTDPTIHNMWELCLPLNSKKQVAHVRKELHGRILKAISNKKLVAREVEREKSERLFAFQTLNSIMTEVVSTLGPHGGQIYNEADYLKFLEKCKDTTFLKEIYDKHWAPSVIGEFLAIPK